jgi:hypothetical protein
MNIFFRITQNVTFIYISVKDMRGSSPIKCYVRNQRLSVILTRVCQNIYMYSLSSVYISRDVPQGRVQPIVSR